MCWLELGLGIPRSGGEKNYLERVFTKPKGLMSIIFMVLTTTLYTSSPNAVAFGRYFLFMCGKNEDGWLSRGLGVIVTTVVVAIHSFLPNTGRVMMKWLGIAKLVMLLAMIIIGFCALSGALKPPGNPRANFHNAFKAPADGPYCPAGYDDPTCTPEKPYSPNAAGFAYALMNIIFSYAGWNSGNYVLGEVKNPNRNMKIAGVVSIGTVAVVYMLANIAIFAGLYRLVQRGLVNVDSSSSSRD
jgi:amino acid transporter